MSVLSAHFADEETEAGAGEANWLRSNANT